MCLTDHVPHRWIQHGRKESSSPELSGRFISAKAFVLSVLSSFPIKSSSKGFPSSKYHGRFSTVSSGFNAKHNIFSFLQRNKRRLLIEIRWHFEKEHIFPPSAKGRVGINCFTFLFFTCCCCFCQFKCIAISASQAITWQIQIQHSTVK